MKYIQRNLAGEAISVYANRQPGYAEEEVPDDYVRPFTAEEAAAQMAQSTERSAITQAKADATVHYLVTHTPQECYDKVMADVGTLAQAKEMMGRLSIALSALAHKQLR